MDLMYGELIVIFFVILSFYMVFLFKGIFLMVFFEFNNCNESYLDGNEIVLY